MDRGNRRLTGENRERRRDDRIRVWNVFLASAKRFGGNHRIMKKKLKEKLMDMIILCSVGEYIDDV